MLDHQHRGRAVHLRHHHDQGSALADQLRVTLHPDLPHLQDSHEAQIKEKDDSTSGKSPSLVLQGRAP